MAAARETVASLGRRALRLAHRGDWRSAPENSVGALIAATRLPGVDGVEFDVRAARDGVPVVIHDADLRRVQGLRARVRDLSAAELGRLGVPTLEEVLVALPRGAFLDVELKEDVGREAIPVLAGARGPGLARAVVSSFEAAALRTVGCLAPAWPRWLNTVALDGAVLARARRLGCRGIAAEWHAIDASTAELVARAGLELAAWTVRREATARRLERLGVVAICVEGPALGVVHEDVVDR
ncbi:MAG: hypothetical protein A2X23_11500 [Chloroflexi bacterium GWC2_73_18]|nr:MAG: hypothetical protein A2X23_11500 [Chloroflexi bacterium GWC2_73_18]